MTADEIDAIARVILKALRLELQGFYSGIEQNINSNMVNLGSNRSFCLKCKSEIYDSAAQKAAKEPYSESFEEFWDAYPRKINKSVAFSAWKRLLRHRPLKEGVLVSVLQLTNYLIKSAHEYAEHCNKNKTEEQYTLHPSTFLNKDRWKEYCYEPATQNRVAKRVELITPKPSEADDKQEA